jgi:hypothetical protein
MPGLFSGPITPNPIATTLKFILKPALHHAGWFFVFKGECAAQRKRTPSKLVCVLENQIVASAANENRPFQMLAVLLGASVEMIRHDPL